ncbi:MAG TPA: NfeD family protein [Sphingomonadales bacterium]|nr:NfeD family protein [Sphingomonadales bacterium]
MMAFIVFLAVVGVVLVILELFLPGAVIGILGGLCMMGAVILTFFGYGLGPAFILFIGLFAATLVIIFGGFRILPQTAMGKKLILSEDLGTAKSSSNFQALQGKEGVATTMLRPAGKAEFDGRQYDVVTEVGFINVGEKVKVVAIEGARVVVRAA